MLDVIMAIFFPLAIVIAFVVVSMLHVKRQKKIYILQEEIHKAQLRIADALEKIVQHLGKQRE